MQSRISISRLSTCAKLVLAILPLVAALLGAHAQSPTRDASEIFTVIAGADDARVHVRLEGRGRHCWATTSDDGSVGISIGDELCSAAEVGAADDSSLVARVMPNKISFRLNGKSYSINDPNTIKSARSLFDPLLNLEAQQSDLAAKQRALGEKQREIGRQRREAKVPIPDMGADIQKIQTDAKRLSSDGGTQSELGDLQSELGDLQARIGDLQAQAGDEESKFGDHQSELADQQSELGDQQSELGDKAQALAMKVSDQLREMLAHAVDSGAAKPE